MLRVVKNGVERRPVRVRTADGLDLTFWLWDQQKVRDKLLIVAPGFAQHHGTNIMRQVARTFWHRRDVLGVDFRGVADTNPGRYTFGRKEHLDLQAAFAWARRMRYKHVELVGFSMGAYIGLRALAEDPGPVKRFYFVSGPTCIEDIVKTLGPARQVGYFLRHPGQIKLRFWAGSQILFRWGWPLGGHPHGTELAARLKVPTHFLIGSEDRLVLPSLTRAVHAATRAPKTLTVFEGGQHAEYMAVVQRERFLAWMERRGLRA